MALGHRIVAAATIALLGACTPSSDWYVQRLLNDQVTGSAHDCVPLGWNPARVDANFFYVGYSAEVDETDWYLPPPWVAGFARRGPVGPAGRTARELLGHLERAGMVSERRRGGSTQFHLTAAGFERFFDDDNFGNNRLHNPYVCYSKLAPRTIVWKEPVRLERDPLGPGQVRIFRVAFTWTASPDPWWAPDDFIRRHTIILGPAKSPAIATFVRRGNAWDLEGLDPAVPDRIADPAAWPT